MLVWQDFVNPNQSLPEGSKPAFEQQGKEMLQQLHYFEFLFAPFEALTFPWDNATNNHSRTKYLILFIQEVTTL
jgi:hypothetical protein